MKSRSFAALKLSLHVNRQRRFDEFWRITKHWKKCCESYLVLVHVKKSKVVGFELATFLNNCNCNTRKYSLNWFGFCKCTSNVVSNEEKISWNWNVVSSELTNFLKNKKGKTRKIETLSALNWQVLKIAEHRKNLVKLKRCQLRNYEFSEDWKTIKNLAKICKIAWHVIRINFSKRLQKKLNEKQNYVIFISIW